MAKGTKNKKISLIVATVNKDGNLNNLLQSLKHTKILSQKDIQVIIVDNSQGNNEVKNVCNKYNVTYIRQPIPGKSRSVNEGIKQAKGRYLAFTDDDVVIKDPDWLTKLHQHYISDNKIGYVSGNVLAQNTTKSCQIIWERKGGLSKGTTKKVWRRNELDKKYKYKFVPWPINDIAAGANCMIPKEVINKVGLISEFLDPGAPIPHGATLEIVYRIIREGYDVLYDPKISVYHKHPSSSKLLRQKLYTYGVGNSSYQLLIFSKYKDYRSLYWGLLGHNLYVLKNSIKSLFGKYPLPFTYTIYSLFGSIAGTFIYYYRYINRNTHTHV